MDPESEKQGSKSLEEKRRLQQGLGLQEQGRWGSQEEEPAPPPPASRAHGYSHRTTSEVLPNTFKNKNWKITFTLHVQHNIKLSITHKYYVYLLKENNKISYKNHLKILEYN